MPEVRYSPRHPPPYSRVERYLSHLWEANLAFMSLLTGITVIIDSFTQEELLFESVTGIHFVHLLATGVVMAAGSLALIWALLIEQERESLRWRLAETGWILLAPAWFSYALVYLIYLPGAVFSWGIPLAIGISGVGQLFLTRHVENRTRETIRRAQEGKDE